VQNKRLRFLSHIIKSNFKPESTDIPRVLKRLSLTQSTKSDTVRTEIIPGVPVPCLWQYTVLATVSLVVEIY
jgi:hypothetical protein